MPSLARRRRRLALGILAYATFLAALTVSRIGGPERFWWSTLDLYMPQWIWGAPGLALLAATARIAWKWSWMPALLLLWVAGPLMGFCWPLFRPEPSAGRPFLRVMTYNVEWGRRDRDAVVSEIINNRPDLLLMQDVGSRIREKIGSDVLRDWHVRAEGQYLLASRFPIVKSELFLLTLPGDHSRTFSAMRCEIEWDGSRIAVYNVHLLTPRDGLSDLKRGDIRAIRALSRNAAARLFQSASLVERVRNEEGPVILAGDLNTPIQGLACRVLLHAGLRDAFSSAGRGYGYTYGHAHRLAHSFLRIDHILAGPHWEARRCRTGSPGGSDHRPVIAELVFR